jgi:hypothetical protein
MSQSQHGGAEGMNMVLYRWMGEEVARALLPHVANQDGYFLPEVNTILF